jgi:TPR repeat protein
VVSQYYRDGQGVESDLGKSLIWCRRAADSGLPEGQYNLGLKYEKGEGLAQDADKAAYWFDRAAQQGHLGAQGKLRAKTAQK